MTTRSFESLASERRLKNRVTDDDLFNYTLRVAYLTYLLTPKPSESPTTSSVVSKDSRDRESKDVSTKISAYTSSLADSFTDLLSDFAGRDAGKVVKFPERLIKVLEGKLQDIFMGKDPKFTDLRTRRIMGLFLAAMTQKDSPLRQQTLRNRKIEELILSFVTTATSSLRKDTDLGPDGWKLELNNQIAHFVRVLRDTLRLVSHVPPELTMRMDMYAEKLVPQNAADVARAAGSAYPEPSTSTHSTFGIHDMPLVKEVGKLFDKSDDELYREVQAIRGKCTEKAALLDLKGCLKNIHAGLPFPGRREDFPDDAAFLAWKATEQSHLSQLMVMMVQYNPELAKATPSDGGYSATGARPGSLYSATPRPRHLETTSISSQSVYTLSNGLDGLIGSDDEGSGSSGNQFTYIPPNPRKYYKKLIEKCVEHDLRAMHTLPEDQEVSLGILSPGNLDVINECALRWRIMQSYRVLCFLDVIKYKYEREEVPLECIPEAIALVEKAFQEQDVNKWHNQDREYLATVYSSIFNIFLSSFYHALDALPNLSRKAVAPFLNILERVQASGLLERYQVDIDARMGELSDRVRIIAVHHYTDQSQEVFTQQTGVNRALPFLLLSDSLESLTKKLDKAYAEPILGRLDIVSLFVETQIPLFLTDLEEAQKRLLEGSMNQPIPDVPIEDIFALYRRTKILLDIFSAFAANASHHFDIVPFFAPYVKEWLNSTDSRTGQWVQTAIVVDKFEPAGNERHSSSIVDLFDSLNTPVNFLLDLKWNDQYQEAKFLTSLARIISKSVEQYCRRIEELFMEEMFPRPSEPYLQPQKQSAWLEKAKGALTSEKRIEPFNFTTESCVKINNIEAARSLLDKIYNLIDADRVSEVIQEEESMNPVSPTTAAARQRNLFTVKVTIAENLVPPDGRSCDTFVTLSDEHGSRMAKTRTIYETTDPRWEETFDISVEKTLWLMASVRDRHLVGKHDTVGRAYICLDPKRFGDFLAHDLWLDLDTQGRLLLRVSMEGEQDDILFFFGRAFRSLKRTEGDMVRIFIDKMSPFVRQVLSRSTLKQLTKSGTTLDYTKAVAGVQSLWGSLGGGGSSSEPSIPLPQSEKPRFKQPDGPTDEAVVGAIGPLWDYLNSNLQVLNSSLSDHSRDTVMAKIWKDVLATIEGLLVPPLSEAPSSMRQLYDKEVDIVFKWLKELLIFFHAEGEGMSMEDLQNAKYREVMSIRFYYDWDTDQLMEEAVKMMQPHLRAAPTMKKRAKTVLSQRSLGTIKDRKREKRTEKAGDNSAETILKILRMRPNTSDFLAQQIQIMNQIHAEQEIRRVNNRMSSRRDKDTIPPLPGSRR